MAAADFATIAASAAVFLSQAGLPLQLPSPSVQQPTAGTSPTFATPGRELQRDLTALGCSDNVARALEVVYLEGCQQVAARCAESFFACVDSVQRTFAPGDGRPWVLYRDTLVSTHERRYSEATRRMRGRLLDEVRSAQARHAASPAAHEPQEPGQFTPDVLSILHAAFNAADHVSKAERRTLAAATALSERQILTWFANQRQRRNKVGKKQQLLGHRSTPYSSTARPRHPQQQQQHYQQQSFDPHARRTVSGSSSGSASSSLVEYESAHSSARSSASSDWSPTSGTYLARGDIPVFVDERREVVPLAAHDAVHEPQFSLPCPPHLAPPPLVNHLPPPPSHYQQETPYDRDERADVPMMHLEAPTPLEAAFPRALDAAPEPHWSRPHALEPDAHGPLDDLSASYPSSSAGADSRRSSADSAFSFATAPGGEPAFVPPPQEQGFFLAPAPAPTPAVAALGGLSDAWMDDQFYENLFGSLGLDLGGGGVGGAAQDGVMSMGGEGSAPGLTLSMEAVRAEEQLGGGGEGAWF